MDFKIKKAYLVDEIRFFSCINDRHQVRE